MKRFFLLSIIALILQGFINSLQAQTDKTGDYLQNADFETTPIVLTESNVSATEKDTVGANGTGYNIPGWTTEHLTAGYPRWVTVNYGITFTAKPDELNGVDPPSASKDGTTGAGLMMSGGYAATVVLTQSVTLPAGKYDLQYDVINQNPGKSIASNRFGFVSAAGATYYDSETAFSGSWTTRTVSFMLLEETAGKISIGLVGFSGGSGDNGKLCIDNVKLYYTDLLSGKKAELQSLIDKCNTFKDDTDDHTDGDIISTFATAISNASTAHQNASTVEDLEAAITALQAAYDVYFYAAQPNNGYSFDYTFKIVNPDFEQSNGTNHPGWTNPGGIGTFSGANTIYSGAPSPNKVADNTVNNSLYQAIGGLQAGVYQVKAVARGASGAVMYIEASAGSWQSANTVSVPVNAIGDTGGELNYGWARYTAPQILKPADEDLYIGDRRVSGGWRSSDAYELVYLGAGYKVIFEENEGSPVNDMILLANGDGKITKPEDPDRTGYDFVGWFTDEDCSSAFDFAGAISGDTTLYAKWNVPYEGGEVGMLKAELSKLLATLTNYEGKVPSAFLAAAKEEGESALNAEDADEESLTAATASVTDAIALAAPLVTPYAGLTAFIDSCQNIRDHSAAEVSDSTAFADAISAATDDGNDATLPEDITDAHNVLETALRAYVLAAQPGSEYSFDYTFKIVNPDFEQSSGTDHPGWTNPGGIGTFNGANTVYTGAPSPNKVADGSVNNSLYQAIDGLPAGVYQVKAVARGASGTVMCIEASAGLWQSANTVSVQVNTAGDQGGELNYGWARYTTPQILKPESDSLFIGERRVSGSTWRSSDAYELVYFGEGYNVTFEENGGSAVNDTILLANGDGKITRPEEPTHTEYDFAGWFTDADCRTEFDFDGAISGDTVLYAKWGGISTGIEKPAISGNDPVVETRWYTLQGVAVRQPADRGVYIIRTVRQSGREEMSKIIYMK